MADDDEPTETEIKATLEVMKAVWAISKQYNICTTCLMFNAASQVQMALEDGDIGHGPPGDAEFEVIENRSRH